MPRNRGRYDALQALTLRITALLRNVGIVIVSVAGVRDSRLSGVEVLGFVCSMVGVTLYQHARRNPGVALWDMLRPPRR